MTTTTFEAFKALKSSEGYDEVLVREWAADAVADWHEHPFDADALVVKGEFWLTRDGVTTHLQPGDVFQVPRGVRHREQYGPQCAVFWAARRN